MSFVNPRLIYPLGRASYQDWLRKNLPTYDYHIYQSDLEISRDAGNSWKEIRIKPQKEPWGWLQQLPSAKNFEYGGYVVGDRIRYLKCSPTSATVPHRNPVNFHSHPTAHPNCDAPSVGDIRSFVWQPDVRAITVGRKVVWVFEKTPESLPVIKSIFSWQRKHLIKSLGELSRSASANDFAELIFREAIGLDWPKQMNISAWNWPIQIAETLKFRVTILRRDSR